MRLLKPLAHGPIARLWGALSLSAVGDQLHQMALVWLAVGLVGPDTGYVAAADTVALMAVALLAGAWVERWDQGGVMMAADLARAGLAAVPVLAALTGHLTLWTLVVPSVALSALAGLFDPALQASLPRLTADRSLLAATNALFDGTLRLARLVGPTLAGALATLMPPVALMGVNGLSFLASACAVFSVRSHLADPAARTPMRKAAVEALAGRLLAGWRLTRREPPFTYLLWRSGLTGGLWTLTIWLSLPLLVRQQDLAGFGLSGLSALALLFSAYGAGNLISNLVVGSLHPGGMLTRRPMALVVAGDALVGGGFVVMALATVVPAPWTLPALALAAAATATGGPLCQIPITTLRQTRFSGGEIAAVFRLFLVLDCLGTLTAMTAAPTLLNLLPTPLVMAACGAAILGMALVFGRRAGRHTLVAG
ncbi:MFS transporter [Nitrospirillum sp. BR 11163]|uniref:MFS transporter n=1 Tax=Nitrospirillum sp. BR 11163 TaxID=3104323 RepID=UPI002AFE4937|nr:MFS transporter [Nitrospirillum sp. BR 11163]MEA1674394.1 MFS transporter [Nitrospirillum sp. BR 11163]